MFCTRCGAELEEDAVFCSECGKKIEVVAKAVTEVEAAHIHTEKPVGGKTARRKDRFGTGFYLAALGLSVLLLLYFLLWKRFNFNLLYSIFKCFFIVSFQKFSGGQSGYTVMHPAKGFKNSCDHYSYTDLRKSIYLHRGRIQQSMSHPSGYVRKHLEYCSFFSGSIFHPDPNM